MNTKQNNNLPKEYFLGQEYFNDIDFIDIAIKVEILYKTLLDNFFFKYLYFDKELAVSWIQKDAMVQILIEDVRIPRSLLNDLMANKSEQYILAFINKILPKVNNELQRQKYRTGNILISNISFLDIQKITLIYFEEKKGWQSIIIRWPFFPKQFPPLQKFSWQEYPPVYIRDYIDAMEMYIKYDFDDCIRKIITSLENCFYYYKLKVTKKFERITPFWLDRLINFKGRITKIIRKYITQPVIQKNIIFIYSLRNKIVHEGFSLKSNQGWVCKKAIGTMSYIFQHPFVKLEEKEYIFSLVMQFLLITQEISGIDLKERKLSYKQLKSLSEREKERLVVKTPKDLDNFMFSGLEITEKEKKRILKG